MAAVKVAVVGGGWAGLAAAVAACKKGHQVTVFEAAKTLGGRARALPVEFNGQSLTLDNGQHILIGAYTHTLQLMRELGVEERHTLLRLPLSLPYPDGTGLQTPAWAARWPAPLDALAAMVTADGWTWTDKYSLIAASLRWQANRFACDSRLSVAELCQSLSARVVCELIEPLCVSALNTPAQMASAQVFLRVLKDALFGARGSSNLLLPRTDLGSLLPVAAQRWLTQSGAKIHTGTRVQGVSWQAPHWQLNGQAFDRVIWASGASQAHQAIARCLQQISASDSVTREMSKQESQQVVEGMQRWVHATGALRFEAIATVYAWSPDANLTHPMLALRSTARRPAQFVFDRGQLGGPQGLLAFVISASELNREAVEAAVMQQAHEQLGLHSLQPVQTVVEKRATFACTPQLLRPEAVIAPGLIAAGDYVAGPYPATLEGAVRSGTWAGAQP